jgi:glycosyltransferase involved in cell wall biosynthesis
MLTRILVLIPTLDIGGAEMDLVRNLPVLNRSLFVPVVCPLEGDGPLAAALRDAGIDVVHPNLNTRPSRRVIDWLFYGVERVCQSIREHLALPLVSGLAGSIARYIQLSRFAARYMEETNSQIVHAILPSSYLVAVVANMLTRRRSLIMSRVSLNYYQKDHWVFGLLERWFFHRRLDIAIGNSPVILAELGREGIPSDRMALVYNGIDTAAFVKSMIDRRLARDRLGISQDALVISSVANLFRYKGHAELLRALSVIERDLPPDWFLLAVGRDAVGHLSELRALIDELGLSSHIRFLGQREDVPAVLSAADIHVSASFTEGFPNNILEAMCAGLPVVATAVGGVPEQVVHGETGLLVPSMDINALGAAVLNLAKNCDLRLQMGRSGRESVQRRFPIESSVNGLARIYSRLDRRITRESISSPWRARR